MPSSGTSWARLLGGKGKTAAQVVAATQIKADIAADAVKKPIAAGGAEAKAADSFYQSVYGTGKPHREETLKELFKTGDANTKAQQAYDASSKDPKATPETKAAALKKWQDSYQAFMAAHVVDKVLPEEAPERARYCPELHVRNVSGSCAPATDCR